MLGQEEVITGGQRHLFENSSGWALLAEEDSPGKIIRRMENLMHLYTSTAGI